MVERGKDEEEGEAMDTPERSKNGQIAVPLSKVEESPVFSFLNSLSPIGLVKPMQISQTINPLNCTSPPLVFASPHISSLGESRLLRRIHLLDPSKPEFSSIDGDKNPTAETNIHDSDEKLNGGNRNPNAGDSEVRYGEPSFQNLGSSVLDPSTGLKSDLTSTHSLDYMALVPLAKEAVQGSSYVREAMANVGGLTYQIDQDIEATTCDWESLMNASDLLIFESPNVTSDARRKSIDQGPTLYASIDQDMHHMTTEFGPNNESDKLCTQPGEGNEMLECTENSEIAADMKINDSGETVEYEHLPGFFHGMRRRCLVFEMAGARTKHSDSKQSTSSVLPQLDCNTSKNEERQLVLTKKGNDSLNCGLPGIGLHLNAIAATPKDFKIISQDSSASGRLLIGQSSSSVNLQTSSPGQELITVDEIVNFDSSQRNTVNEEVNPSSPKKKRRREQDTAAGACKRCNCKKSKCLKLYCECFAAGVYCVEPCACIDCFNKPIHEDTVLATRKQIESRNPLAFAPKVIRDSDPITETGVDSTKTPASARHKRGCNCKKSGCLKKYCECYQSGVGCSINCRCEGCKNAFGRKDGSGVIVMELEVEEDEADKKNEKAILDIDSAPPSTPLRASRLYTNKGSEKTSSYFDTIREVEEEDDEQIPDFLRENSPIEGIKSSSPNGKRVSPPHSGNSKSPSQGLRSSRKLILRSIPSFPSLTTNQ